MSKIVTTLFGELALLAIQPEAPVEERLEFYTDVQVSHNGKERRYARRMKARQFFTYSFLASLSKLPAVFHMAYGAIRDRWALPIWGEAQYVGDVAASTLTIPCDTTVRDIRDDSLVLLYNGSEWQVLEVETATATDVTFYVAAAAIQKAYIIPIRLAYVSGDVKKVTSGYADKYQIEFEIEDNPFLITTPPDQYLSEDIYFTQSVESGSTTQRAVTKKLDKNDYTIGVVERRTPWVNSRYETSRRTVMQGLEEVRAYKEFLFRRAGKFRSFWAPTFESNLRLVDTGLITTTITIEEDDFTDYALRDNIAFELGSGVWLTRVVSNPVLLPGGLRLELTLNTSLNVLASDIKRVSFLGLHRLNSDSISLRWVGNNVVESEVAQVEIRP